MPDVPSNSRYSLKHTRARLESNRQDLRAHRAECVTCAPGWPCSIAVTLGQRVLRLVDEVRSLQDEARQEGG